MPHDITHYKKQLLQIARASIEHGLQHNAPLTISLVEYDDLIKKNGASFVTLHKNNQLRGCIGQLQASRPLVMDIAMNAYAAAFQDPRFPSLSNHEYPDITLDISILSEPEILTARNEKELFEQIEPGKDGLILEKGQHRATFLPSVWEQLPDPKDFLRHLKHKAGLNESDDSDITYFRYHTIYLQEDT